MNITRHRSSARAIAWTRALARIAGAVAIVLGSAETAELAARPAQAAVGGCWHGTGAGTTNWGWGSCSGVTGSTHWRLQVSCTWGNAVYSSWFYGPGRTGVECPWPGAVRSTQIDVIY